jgi:hypothetical protein
LQSVDVAKTGRVFAGSVMPGAFRDRGWKTPVVQR